MAETDNQVDEIKPVMDVIRSELELLDKTKDIYHLIDTTFKRDV